MSGIGDPADRLPVPDICTWAGSVDAIVVGRLLDLRLVDVPMVLGVTHFDEAGNLRRWRWVDTCQSGTISSALDLEVEILSALRGDLEGVVTGRVGMSQRGRFSPMPYRDSDDGSLRWTTNLDRGEPLEPGQLLGLALHYLPEHDVWSLMGETLFGLDGDGRVVFQAEPYGGSFFPLPEDAIRLTLQELTAEIAACEPTPAAMERRNLRWQVDGPALGGNPAKYLTALCHPSAEEQEEARATDPYRCETDADCPEGTGCLVGSCVEWPPSR